MDYTASPAVAPFHSAIIEPMSGYYTRLAPRADYSDFQSDTIHIQMHVTDTEALIADAQADGIATRRIASPGIKLDVADLEGPIVSVKTLLATRYGVDEQQLRTLMSDEATK